MNSMQKIKCLTSVLFLALAAVFPLWTGCSKAEKPTVPDARQEDAHREGQTGPVDSAPTETAPQTTTEIGGDVSASDGQVKVVQPGESFDELIASAPVVVVDFNATWCAPCRELGPYLERMAKAYKSHNVSFFSVDVDEHSELARELDISSIPDVRIYVDGKPVDKQIGCEPIELMQKIEAAIKNVAK
ncbi:MAG: thioredoxin family protein [Thermoguttaceae bacterium]|jgi:thioredoxin 1